MPVVSVIMPVYNGEVYLKEAIDSILAQTFRDFEFIIVNDGSRDSSGQVIRSFTDERIRFLENDQNRGLVYTLNRAVAAAKGTYIARMDADDIALPERLEKQVKYLQNNIADLVATTVMLIDEKGQILPDWKDDRRNISYKNIKHYLRTNNCIAHPTVMGKADLFRKYPYQHEQKYAEDYDLWLRIVADGWRIEKINEPLLLYRVLSTSFTRSKKLNIFYGLATVKFRFFRQQLRKRNFSAYVLSLFPYACLDLLKAAGKEMKAFFKK